MKIKKMISQHRRDFYADMECESCGHIEEKVSGYDDDNFHVNVIPTMRCKKCGESTITANKPIEPQATKYSEGFQI